MDHTGVEEKTWGKRPFWGVSFDYDPQWLLDDEQKKLQRQLIQLCRTTLRHNAVSCNEMPCCIHLRALQRACLPNEVEGAIHLIAESRALSVLGLGC